MSEHRRVDTDSFKEMIANLPAGELERINQLQHEQAVDEHNRFKEHYQRDECYLCGKHFKTISKKNPCLHWLLRRCKFKSKDFSKIYQKFDYFQISSFLRWVANAERFQGNINDLLEEKDERKLFQATIKWKNIEWTPNVLAPSPVFFNKNKIFLTGGYGAGATVIEINEKNNLFEAKTILNYKPKFGLASEQQTPILFKDHLYGILPKDAGFNRNQFVCYSIENLETEIGKFLGGEDYRQFVAYLKKLQDYFNG